MPINNARSEDVEVFDKVITNAEKSVIAPGEIILGTITSIDALGQPQVDFPLNATKSAITAITTIALNPQHTSRQVALLFNQGDISQPIVIGLIHSPLQAMLDNFEQDKEYNLVNKSLESVSTLSVEPVELSGQLNADDVQVDGGKITFEAQDEMVFKCGKSSITLTKSGKILIRGEYLLNRSSGVNRIMGGSVQVN